MYKYHRRESSLTEGAPGYLSGWGNGGAGPADLETQEWAY